jgi:NDP-sugar pyrophosphorylase family protein
MQAIILAGGLGTRLRPLVSDVPKPLAEVAGRPFLEYLLLQLERDGINEVVVCAGFMGDAFADRIGRGDRFGLEITYSIEPEPQGTAGALKYAEPHLRGEEWLLMNGDSLFDISLARLIDAHRAAPALVTMALARVADDGRYGRVATAPDGLVIGFEEKAQTSGSGLINSGLYIIQRPLLALIPADRPVSLEREVLPPLAGSAIRGVPFDGYFVDIGVPDDYVAAQRKNEVFERLNQLD